MSRADSDSGGLQRNAALLGVDLTEAQGATLLAFVDLLYLWNRNIGLTTIAREDALRLHVLDCLAAVPLVGRGPCIDLGSGAGLPGIVLAIALPDVDFTLVESNRRRCSFLLEARRKLALANVTVVEADADSLAGSASYACVISRAFRPPVDFLQTACRFVGPDGIVVLMLADAGDEELGRMAGHSGLSLDSVVRVTLPGGSEPRALAVFRHPRR